MRKIVLIVLLLNVFGFASDLANVLLSLGNHAWSAGDYAKGIGFYKRACYAGSAKGCILVGVCYVQGLGVKTNKKIAKEFYKRACDLGDKLGCYGYAYFNVTENIMWKKKLFSKKYNSRIDKIVKIKDGFLISGAVNTNGFIIKIDNNGKIIWKKIIETDGEGIFYDIYEIIHIGKKFYLLTLPSAGNYGNIKFALLDNKGNIVKNEELNLFPTTYKVYKNNIFIGGFIYSSKKKKMLNALEKFNIYKGKVWEKEYEEQEDSLIESILVANNSIYILSDNKNMTKLNFDGEIIYKKTFKDENKLPIKINDKLCLNKELLKQLENALKGEITAVSCDNKNIMVGINKNDQAILLKFRIK